MIVEAHMRRLREIQVRKAEASSLVVFVRRLEDARRVLTSVDCNYMNRMDNEDVLVMLMRKRGEYFSPTPSPYYKCKIILLSPRTLFFFTPLSSLSNFVTKWI